MLLISEESDLNRHLAAQRSSCLLHHFLYSSRRGLEPPSIQLYANCFVGNANTGTYFDLDGLEPPTSLLKQSTLNLSYKSLFLVYGIRTRNLLLTCDSIEDVLL